VNTKQLTSC